MIWVSGLDKLCTFFNKPWLEFTGRTMEQEMGDGWARGVHPDDFDRCLAIYSSAFDARRSFHMEYRLQRADGEYRWILDSGIPQHRDGEFIGFIGSCIDVTEQKMIEGLLRSNATALQDSEQELRALAGNLLTAQEDERRRLSRELHDDVTQRLAFLSIELGKLAAEIPDLQDNTQLRIRALQSQTLQISAEVRRLSHGLHPSVIEDFGLSIALEEFCQQFAAARGIHVEFEGFVEDSQLDAAGATCLYRVAQESLHNAVIHGRSTEIRVELTADAGFIHLRVRDNGTGFSDNETRAKTGLGLISMRERIRFVQGKLTISSQPGQGAEIAASVPLARVGDVVNSHSDGSRPGIEFPGPRP
jgi:PAS domain S-box-containing protein